MKAKLIGIGAAGNKAAIKLLASGILPRDSVRLFNTTSKDISSDYEDISVIFGDTRGGCGKERELATELMKRSLKNKLITFDFLDEDDDLVIIVNSSEGGTGCGASTILAKYLNDVLGKNVHLFVFTGFEQDARGLQNTVGYFKDLSDEVTVQAISNKKFLQESKNKQEAELMANEEFVKRISILLGSRLEYQDQNIDDTDLYKLVTTPGYMTIERIDASTVKNTADYTRLIDETFDYSKSLDFEKSAKRIGIFIHSSRNRLEDIDIDTEAITAYTGEPFEMYNHIQKSQDSHVDIIVAGLKLPTEEVRDVFAKYLERTATIDKSEESFFDEAKDFNALPDDSLFNIGKKKPKKSVDDFFDEEESNSKTSKEHLIQTERVITNDKRTIVVRR